jgi:hypothetical protein
MSRSVKEVFDIAIHLIDAQNESTGATETTDTKEYLLRTPNLLNSILNRAYPYSDTYVPVAEKRPVHPKVSAPADLIEMDDYICLSVLPYGLAALLVNPEGDGAIASFLWQMFEEGLMMARNSLPAGIESVDNVYGGFGGGIEYGEFSKW